MQTTNSRMPRKSSVRRWLDALVVGFSLVTVAGCGGCEPEHEKTLPGPGPIPRPPNPNAVTQ